MIWGTMGLELELKLKFPNQIQTRKRNPIQNLNLMKDLELQTVRLVVRLPIAEALIATIPLMQGRKKKKVVVLFHQKENNTKGKNRNSPSIE